MTIQKAEDAHHPAKFLALKAISYCLRAVRWALLGAVACMVVASFAKGHKDIKKYPQLAAFVAWEAGHEKPALDLLKPRLPSAAKGKERWILGIGVFLLATVLGNLAASLSFRAQCFNKPPDTKEQESEELMSKLALLQKGELTRTDLLELTSQTKRTSERYRRHLTFLSITVSNPTAMKQGEDPSVAERDFKRYKSMVDGILAESSAFKLAWTPDGVMICFLETRQAVLAGQKIIQALVRFNKEVKMIRSDFAVYAGLNSGELLTHDSIPMEEMADRVIDIAGHMMKHGAVNAICASEHAVKPLLSEFKFNPAGREVDGCPVYQWTPT